MAIEVFNRYEYKYIINTETLKHIVSVINEHMVPDRFCKNSGLYTISNLYYDTPDNAIIRHSLSKPVYKEKLRLRSYGIPDKNSHVFLEIKKKYKGLVNKRRTDLYLDEAYELLNNHIPPKPAPHINFQVLHEIEYFLERYENLAPRVYIAYDRLAFFEEDNPDLRISFDTNLRTRRYDLELEAGDYGDALIDEDLWVMEIKTSRAMPLWLSALINNLGVHRQSFSKYGTEFKKYIIQSVRR